MFLKRGLKKLLIRFSPNLRGAISFPAGHFYSPLIDLSAIGPADRSLPNDDEAMWEHVDLRPIAQQKYFEELLRDFSFLPFPPTATPPFRYHYINGWFPPSDAFTLSGILRKERPQKIIEVGCGFSSAVMLDTLRECQQSAAMWFIEPNPERLNSLLTPADRATSTIVVQPVQEVDLSLFDELGERDVLFIDSSHVAKIGSDLSYLILRVLPRLRPGVIVHLHDIFYPHSYPIDWIREGTAWNESLFLRAALIDNPKYEVVAFNSYAVHCFPEVFRERFPLFIDPQRGAGSFWMRKVG